MSGTAIVETPSPLGSLAKQIQQSLSGASDEQSKRFAAQVDRLARVENHFQEFPDDWQRFNGQLERAKKALNYVKPYRIAMVGATGAGKSTLINALLGRPLVPSRAGEPATGTVLEIFLDVPDGGREFAEVAYREENDIRRLVQKLVTRYSIDTSKLPPTLNYGFASVLQSLEPGHKLDHSQDGKEEFSRLREAIVEIVTQYDRNAGKTKQKIFYLDDLAEGGDKEKLDDLVDEGSRANAKDSPDRRIGLVKSVTYRLKPDRSLNGLQSLQLPGNVCLVDLPGLGGLPLHDIIISEGIVEADAVLFILNPNRILGETDRYLVHLVKQYISPEDNGQSGERIFIVLNGRDKITKDNAVLPEEVKRAIDKFMRLLFPQYATDPRTAKRGGEMPYFLTSAWLANEAQKKIKGEKLKDPQTYEEAKRKLGVGDGDDRKALEASQVPNLVGSLMKFAQERRIEDKINDGEKSLSAIINALERQCTAAFAQQSTVTDSLLKKRNDELNSHLDKAKEVIRKFRIDYLQGFTHLRQQLEQEAIGICDAADQQLKQNLPGYWKEHYKDGFVEDIAKYESLTLFGPILADAQIRLWGELNKKLPSMADYLIHKCRDSLAQYKLAEQIASQCYGCLQVEEIKTGLERFIAESSGTNLNQMAQRLAMVQMTYPGYSFNAKTKDGKPAINPSLSEILSNISPRLSEIVGKVLSGYVRVQTGMDLAPAIEEIVRELTKLLMVAYQQNASLPASDEMDKPVYEMLYRCLNELTRIKGKETESSDFEPLVAEMRKIYQPFVVSGCVDSFLNLYRYELLMIEKYLIIQVVEETFEKIRSGTNADLRARIDQSLAENNPDMKQREAVKRKLDSVQALKGI